METNQSNQPQTPTTSNSDTINTPSFTQTPVQPPSLKKKTPWLLASIIIVLLSATGVLGYKYYELKQQLNNQQENPTPLPSPQLVVSSPSPIVSPATEVDPTAGWKTYTSQNMSITFKYPANLAIRDDLKTSKGKYSSITVLKNEKPFVSFRSGESKLGALEAGGVKTDKPEEMPYISIGLKQYPVIKDHFAEGVPGYKDCMIHNEVARYMAEVADDLLVEISAYDERECTEEGKQIVVNKTSTEEINLGKQIIFTLKTLN
jgi:hypothetical protein